MPGTILDSGYTIVKKTKTIPNFIEFIFWRERQVMSKKTITYTKLQINTIKTIKHSHGIKSHGEGRVQPAYKYDGEGRCF